MSKPESTGAKSLEEILASIRKSLADEASGRPPEPRTASSKAAQQPKPAAPDTGVPAKPASAPAKGGGVLTAKLAGTANGSAHGASLDPDLSELFAGEPKKAAPTTPAKASEPAGKSASTDDGKDPLWFLSRLSAAAAGPAGQGSAARARDAAKAPAPVEEIKLSRPETLRASLPPLFDTVAEPAAATAKSNRPDDAASLTARTQPRVLTPQAEATPAKETPKETPAAKDLGKAEPIVPISAALSALRDEPFAAAPPDVAADKPAPAEAIAATSSMEAKALAAASGEPRPAWTSESAPAATVDALPTRALEQMVAELLEPVIRQWLQSNLPRLIEKAVREEVARVVAAEREAPKA